MLVACWAKHRVRLAINMAMRVGTALAHIVIGKMLEDESWILEDQEIVQDKFAASGRQALEGLGRVADSITTGDPF